MGCPSRLLVHADSVHENINLERNFAVCDLRNVRERDGDRTVSGFASDIVLYLLQMYKPRLYDKQKSGARVTRGSLRSIL